MYQFKCNQIHEFIIKILVDVKLNFIWNFKKYDTLIKKLPKSALWKSQMQGLSCWRTRMAKIFIFDDYNAENIYFWCILPQYFRTALAKRGRSSMGVGRRGQRGQLPPPGIRNFPILTIETDKMFIIQGCYQFDTW